jgi:two-component system, chemotaxis family, chemotaxis protein CheY
MSLLSIKQLEILLVEPSTTQHRIIEDYLLQLGAERPHWTDSGRTALERMRAHPPDLVISAMHLPDMTGTELVQQMRSDDTLMDTAFMLVSSETAIRYLEPLRQAGVIAILPKPFNLEQLSTSLLATLDYLHPDPLQLKQFSPDELRVLIVDDSFTSRRIVRQMLERMGVEQLAEAENGQQAVEMIQHDFFDLIVTDYYMPEMDGEELSQFIRHHSAQQSVPVLMVTSETDHSRLAGIARSGVSAVFDKPFTIDTLRSTIERIL